MHLEAENFTLLQFCFVRTLARREACVGACADAETRDHGKGHRAEYFSDHPKTMFGRPRAVSIQGRVAC